MAMANAQRLRRFDALLGDAVMFAASVGLRLDRKTINCCCPLGAVVTFVKVKRRIGGSLGDWLPVCDVSANYVALALGGRSRDWIDQCRAFEVGYDGSDPAEECIEPADEFYRLGVAYRERCAS